MNDTDREQLRQHVGAWQAAAMKLAEQRREELPLVDTQRSLLNLADAYEACRLYRRPLPTSGLIDQQAWFRRLREND